MNSDNLIDNSLIILKNLFSQHSFKSSIYKKEKKVVIKHDKNIFFDIYDKELEQNKNDLSNYLSVFLEKFNQKIEEKYTGILKNLSENFSLLLFKPLINVVRCNNNIKINFENFNIDIDNNVINKYRDEPDLLIQKIFTEINLKNIEKTDSYLDYCKEYFDNFQYVLSIYKNKNTIVIEYDREIKFVITSIYIDKNIQKLMKIIEDELIKKIDDRCNEFIKNLKVKFCKIPFFVRIYNKKDRIIIWNDHDINYEIMKNQIGYSFDKQIEELKNNIYDFFVKKIEEKYKAIESRKISIIIPNYNNELTIKNTISSILKNKYENIEIIIVDDCSTDNSVNIINENFAGNPKVKLYFNEKNMGAYYSRNKGILLSTGFYITIVDGDDIINSQKFIFEKNILDGLNVSNKIEIWGFGTGYERLHYENNIKEVQKIETNKTWLPKYLFYRKLFNYIGYFKNNRFSSDSEFNRRAKKYGYKLASDIKKIYYYSFTKPGKNLTQIYDWTTREKWLKEADKQILNKEYIEMALLDIKEDFFKILDFVSKQDNK